MFINVHELELGRREFHEAFAPGVLDLGEEARQQGPLQVEGRAELIEENHGGKVRVQDIRLVGKLSGDLELKCSRCLESVIIKAEADFDLLYRPLKTVKTGEEVSINEAESEIGYYQGEGLLLEDAMKEQVLLTVPFKVLCSEECKGICPQCGQNLNAGQCQCKQEKSDPRWAALADLKDKIKN